MLYSRISQVLAGALLVCAAASAQTQSALTDLAVSANLNTVTHEITAEVSNLGSKTAVAVALSWTQSDAAGQEISQLTTAEDGVYAYAYPDHPEIAAGIAAQQLIRPNQTVIRKLGADPDTVTVKVEVAAIIWDDRTAQGNATALRGIFGTRANDAKALAQALNLLTAAASAAEGRSALLKAGLKAGAIPSILRGEHSSDAVAIIKAQADALAAASRRVQ